MRTVCMIWQHCLILSTDGSVWRRLFGLARRGHFVILMLGEVLIILKVLWKHYHWVPSVKNVTECWKLNLKHLIGCKFMSITCVYYLIQFCSPTITMMYEVCMDDRPQWGSNSNLKDFLWSSQIFSKNTFFEVRGRGKRRKYYSCFT